VSSLVTTYGLVLTFSRAKAIQGPEDEDPLAAANARLRHDGRVALFQSNSMDLPDDVLPDDWQEDVWE
jgi:hypothetical protein